MSITKSIIPVFFTFLLSVSLMAQEAVKVETIEVDFGNDFTQNVYIVYNKNTKDALIIDPGKADPSIEEFITIEKLKVRKILNTHGHGDHIGGNRYYSDLYKVDIIGPAGDKSRYSGRNSKNRPHRFISSEDTSLSAGSLKLTIISTPGHTAGSICFLTGNYLFSGDTLFYESIGRTSTDEAERLQIDGIKKKLLTLPDSTEVFPGHGSSTTIGYEKRHNKFLQ